MNNVKGMNGGEVRMTNEDAIRWLDNLKNDIGNPHYEGLWHYAQAIDEICSLLEEQEAELLYRDAKTITHTATKLDDATCPSCGNVIRLRYDYCYYCGQKLDWEGR